MLATSFKKHFNQHDATNRIGEEEQDALVAHVWSAADQLQDRIGRLLDARCLVATVVLGWYWGAWLVLWCLVGAVVLG